MLNRDLCFAQQPQRVSITVPDALLQNHSDQWLTDFSERLASHLNLSNERHHNQDCSQKEEFVRHLNRHAAITSSYPLDLRHALRGSLKHLYCLFKDDATSPHQRNFIAKRLYDNISDCSAGFHNSTKHILACLNTSTTIDELLAQVRFHLVDNIASVFSQNNAQGVHVHNRIFNIAHQFGYGVWPLNSNDMYRNTGSSNITDETLEETLEQGFDKHFRLFGILNALCKQLEVLFAASGYEGNYTADSQKEYKDYASFSKLANQFTEISDDRLFDSITDEETLTPKVLGIHWQNLKLALLQTLRDKHYLTLSPTEAAALDRLPNVTDKAAFTSLIAHPHELAECLMMYSDWSIEDKTKIVMTYLEGKPFDAQEAILHVLDDEAPILTNTLKRHPTLQALYFQIAVQKNEAGAVKTHIEQGADINAALGLLFNEEHKRETLYWLNEHKHLIQQIKPESMNAIIADGKYKGKTITDMLWSTKKGRQVLLENTALCTSFSAEQIEAARREAPSVVMTNGLFKRPDSLATQLGQYIVHGDLTNAEKILQDHPELRQQLLTEKVTVTDYSRCKKKHLTAFQLALCAWDVKLNDSDSDPDAIAEMLSKYMAKEDIDRQYKAIFTDGHQAFFDNQKPFDFSEIIRTITESNPAEVQKALDLEQPNETTLWRALEKFRKEFTAHSKNETVWNPQHLIEAFEQYDKQYDNWNANRGIQQDLFWRQVIGYTQRFLPANIAMDFAQGLYERAEQKKSPLRTFKFQHGSGSIYPVSVSSGLGYEYAGTAWGLRAAGVDGWRGARAIRGVVRETLLAVYKNLCRAKTAALEKLCSPRRRDLQAGV